MTQVKILPENQQEKEVHLNEVEEALRLAGDAQSKELARSYRSQKFYIVKVVDRDNEEDGVKFWRFKHNWKGDGPIDKIIPIWRNKGDVTDINEGRDLILIYKQYHYQEVEVNTQQYLLLCMKTQENYQTDPAKVKEWTEDDRTWKDVYSQKPVEYLEAISKGVGPSMGFRTKEICL